MNETKTDTDLYNRLDQYDPELNDEELERLLDLMTKGDYNLDLIVSKIFCGYEPGRNAVFIDKILDIYKKTMKYSFENIPIENLVRLVNQWTYVIQKLWYHGTYEERIMEILTSELAKDMTVFFSLLTPEIEISEIMPVISMIPMTISRLINSRNMQWIMTLCQEESTHIILSDLLKDSTFKNPVRLSLFVDTITILSSFSAKDICIDILYGVITKYFEEHTDIPDQLRVSFTCGLDLVVSSPLLVFPVTDEDWEKFLNHPFISFVLKRYCRRQ